MTITARRLPRRPLAPWPRSSRRIRAVIDLGAASSSSPRPFSSSTASRRSPPARSAAQPTCVSLPGQRRRALVRRLAARALARLRRGTRRRRPLDRPACRARGGVGAPRLAVRHHRAPADRARVTRRRRGLPPTPKAAGPRPGRDSCILEGHGGARRDQSLCGVWPIDRRVLPAVQPLRRRPAEQGRGRRRRDARRASGPTRRS